MSVRPRVSSAKRSPQVVLALATGLLLSGMVAFGGHTAALGEQVHYLWDNGIRLTNWYADRPEDLMDSVGGVLVVTESHRLRYAVTTPLFHLADATGLSVDHVYTLTVPVLAAATVWLAVGAAAVALGRPLSWRGCTAILPLALVLTAMDGRLIVAFFGYALVLRVLLRPEPSMGWRLIAVSMGVLFASVSSGTMMSTLCLVAVLSISATVMAPDCIARLLAVVTMAYVGLAFHYDVQVALFKNIEFYGGGLSGAVAMLQHGAGRVLLDFASSPALAVALLCIVAVAGTGLVVVPFRIKDPDLFLGLVVALVLGLFGYSTLSLALIPMSVWGAIGIGRWLDRS